jgi:hypothetical protein
MASIALVSAVQVATWEEDLWGREELRTSKIPEWSDKTEQKLAIPPLLEKKIANQRVAGAKGHRSNISSYKWVKTKLIIYTFFLSPSSVQGKKEILRYGNTG